MFDNEIHTRVPLHMAPMASSLPLPPPHTSHLQLVSPVIPQLSPLSHFPLMCLPLPPHFPPPLRPVPPIL